MYLKDTFLVQAECELTWVLETSFLGPLGRMDWKGKVRGRETNEEFV